MTRCHFCSRVIDPNARETWRLMTGWARRGKAGGSDIACREWSGHVYAHDLCVRRQKNRISPLQEALI